MSTGRSIFAEDLPLSIVQASRQAPPDEEPGQKSLKEQVRGFETRVIVQALDKNNGNRSRTASELGISRRALLYKLHEFNLDDGECADSVVDCE